MERPYPDWDEEAFREDIQEMLDSGRLIKSMIWEHGEYVEEFELNPDHPDYREEDE